MKRTNNILIAALAGIALALAVGMTGCATNQSKGQALVCPDCKTVQVAVENSAWYDRYLNDEPKTSLQMEHNCPGCQGAVKTFFKEGKLQHQCSVCSQNAFTCPVSHR